VGACSLLTAVRGTHIAIVTDSTRTPAAVITARLPFADRVNAKPVNTLPTAAAGAAAAAAAVSAALLASTSDIDAEPIVALQAAGATTAGPSAAVVAAVLAVAVGAALGYAGPALTRLVILAGSAYPATPVATTLLARTGDEALDLADTIYTVWGRCRTATAGTAASVVTALPVSTVRLTVRRAQSVHAELGLGRALSAGASTAVWTADLLSTIWGTLQVAADPNSDVCSSQARSSILT